MADAGRRKRRAKEKVTTKRAWLWFCAAPTSTRCCWWPCCSCPVPSPQMRTFPCPSAGAGVRWASGQGSRTRRPSPASRPALRPQAAAPRFQATWAGQWRVVCAPPAGTCARWVPRATQALKTLCVAPAVRLLLGMWGHAAVAVGRGACAFLIVLHNLHGVAVGGGSIGRPHSRPPARIPRPCSPRLQPVATVGGLWYSRCWLWAVVSSSLRVCAGATLKTHTQGSDFVMGRPAFFDSTFFPGCFALNAASNCGRCFPTCSARGTNVSTCTMVGHIRLVVPLGGVVCVGARARWGSQNPRFTASAALAGEKKRRSNVHRPFLCVCMRALRRPASLSWLWSAAYLCTVCRVHYQGTPC